MADLPPRLNALRPTIEKLMSIRGTAGLSLGVMHKGCLIYHANYGFRDFKERLPVTEDTVFPVCSLSKAVTAAAIGILVEEKKATSNTLVRDTLPAFKIKDETLQNRCTIIDLLCHRTVMSWADNLIVGTENNVLISGENAMKYINSQTRLLPFRGQFAYNNIAFELAGKVIESLSGESYFDFVRGRILDLLA
jgi:CubicO group peptidase (beta-lactamase class C family)